MYRYACLRTDCYGERNHNFNVGGIVAFKSIAWTCWEMTKSDWYDKRQWCIINTCTDNVDNVYQGASAVTFEEWWFECHSLHNAGRKVSIWRLWLEIRCNVSLSFQTSENLYEVFAFLHHEATCMSNKSLISLVFLAGFKGVSLIFQLFRLGNQLATQLNTSLADWETN